MTFDEQLEQIHSKIVTYGKENQGELLYALTEGAYLISGSRRVRIYLEDLPRGVLSCVHATGHLENELREFAFPIFSSETIVSRVFASQYPAEFRLNRGMTVTPDDEFANRFGFYSSYITPLVSLGKSIGVLCIDHETSAERLSGKARSQLSEFAGSMAVRLDEARIYHQQVQLVRRLEEFRAREAASMMVKSAAQLVKKVSLASVLVLNQIDAEEFSLSILASYSDDPQLKNLYDQQGATNLHPGSSLLAQYVDAHGVIVDERLLRPLYIADLTRHTLQKPVLTEAMALRSMYIVPRYAPDSRRVICLVNYFSRDLNRFTGFEMGLLQTHAELVERVISEVGGEHLEIRVLSEISDLLNERAENLQPFLTKVLSKATELIGADTGSIGLIRERDSRKWLVVEDDNGTIIGAKNKEWLKKNIPPFPVGGDDLPVADRSLTGYVAHTKQPKIIGRVDQELQTGGFHRSMSELLKSEIAVPIICDEEVIAVICLNSQHYDYFREEHRRILQIIGSLTARHISDLQRIEGLQSEVNRLTTDVAYKDPHVSSYRLGNIIGNSPTTQAVVEFINTVSLPLFNRITFWSRNIPQEATIGLPSILITGPTGSGKEFFFNNLYNKLNELYRSHINPSGELPVKKTNIASYSGELTYSELFGHKKGAFTGAYNDRRGILEETMGGVVFLDEIGDADPKTQVQLLRFLDNGGFVRLGENTDRFSRVLLVAATNRNLPEEIAQGNFREDLFHRLSELSIRLPSLNERREDISDLSVHFLGKLFRTYRSEAELPDQPPVLSEDAKQELRRHNYQGNIRELRSILLRALFFRTRNTIIGEDIRMAIAGTAAGDISACRPVARDLDKRLAETILERIEAGGDFWTDIYEPFSRSDISRETVRQVIERARAMAGKTMPAVARYLKAVDNTGDAGEVQRRLFKFKNFLYKTVKI
ncbi:GPMC system transcriptional regulator [Pelobacter propionicus]|uniref:Putative GAF sensor protein n=1 Tax=Pelobacter propionicus (strain DSM 2379 / NBRC 103807 / OttBd1) TaxID=338966 RepID=A1AL67_PELPD|nr:GPMC system transcriptional regulator [Pelobacter propionicus]ABK98087.1 putative GAF sensor protein [Pelobacter propionicus DSM 2379]